MALKDELIGFFNSTVKEYDTELRVLEDNKTRKITKEENTLLVVDHLISILDDYNFKQLAPKNFHDVKEYYEDEDNAT